MFEMLLLIALCLLMSSYVITQTIEIDTVGESLGNYVKRQQQRNQNVEKQEVFSRDCLPCPRGKTDNINDLAIMYYWKAQEYNTEDLFSLAYGCACNGLKLKDDKILKAISYDIAKNYLSITNSDMSMPNSDLGPLRNWEILGPLPVGKLEIDGDPTFSKHNSNYFMNKSMEKVPLNVGLHILALPNNITVYSELMQTGKVTWRKQAVTKNIVEIRFPVAWNELVQGISTLGAYEFQGWARTITYVTSKSPYLMQCPGVHTVFIRNNGLTRILTGDIYQGGLMSSIVELSPGPVGILIPLRGAAVMTFSCTLTKIKSSVRALSISQVPDLLEIPIAYGGYLGKGLLLTSVFSLLVQSGYNNPMTVDVQVEASFGIKNRFNIRKAWNYKYIDDIIAYTAETSIVIAPGQTMQIPLEIYTNEGVDDDVPFIPCRKDQGFQVILTTSKGEQLKYEVPFNCRRFNQSFLISYLDHDGSVAQAAVLFPLSHSPGDIDSVEQFVRSFRRGLPVSYGSVLSSKPRNSKCNIDNKSCADIPLGQSFPAVLSLHGTSITAYSQADSYKMMPPSMSEYIFGVKGYWIIAPDRHGAHNWEAVGDLSARLSLSRLQKALQRVPKLPQLSLHGNIIAGHSMGGHGAWMVAVNNPDMAICLSPSAGWIKKEEYGTANLFFALDVSNSFIDPSLKRIFEIAMSEFHVDKLVSNLQNHKVHIRVGSSDTTTHPWYSRRMFRLLNDYDIDCTLEETQGKQHWWWDTYKSNDGGAVNDDLMRNFYSTCLEISNSIIYSSNSSKSFSTMKENKFNLNDGDFDPIVNAPCMEPFTLSVINPGTHEGFCGVQIIQQHKSLSLTTTKVKCNINSGKRSCFLDSGNNVRRMEITLGERTFLHNAHQVTIDNHLVIELFDDSLTTSLSICWDDNSFKPYQCQGPINPLLEKTLRTTGPLRHVYSRPFLIVYGTPQESLIRLAMRDLAVYIGNSNLAAHNTHVRVITDLDYRSSKYYLQDDPPNVIFIGGPTLNKAVKNLCQFKNDDDEKKKHCITPVKFTLHEDNDDKVINFSIGPHVFTNLDQSLIFTLPLQTNETSAMGVCIHANTPEGFLDLSRLAWPVPPPMVRSPYANYIPDYIVINQKIWAYGFGGVVAAGYWNSAWAYDSYQSYISI